MTLGRPPMIYMVVMVVMVVVGLMMTRAQYAYAKRAQMMLTEWWSRRIPGAPHYPVRVHCMHPGWSDTPGVQTSLPDFHSQNQATLRTSEQGADTIVRRSCFIYLHDRLTRHIPRMPTITDIPL
jgi:NAD(P)-dependent dehydrogenase (short-subunit alcohol dehydrogenase family)